MNEYFKKKKEIRTANHDNSFLLPLLIFCFFSKKKIIRYLWCCIASLLRPHRIEIHI